MDRRISTDSRAELVEVLRQRYRGSSKSEKVLILDEFVAVSGYHRKHAIRLLGARRSVKEQQADLTITLRPQPMQKR